MLKGDLSTTPLASLLIDLARETATGSLVIIADDGDEAQLYLKQGLVYAVQVPGARPQLGSKLVSSGALAPEALADALEAQRTELQGWRLGELLVHLGYVEQTVVEAFVKEQVNDAMWDLMRWHTGRWRFRKNVKTREDVAPPMEVVDLLSVLRERGYEWETISSVVHGPSAIPVLSVGGVANPETVLDPEAWSMLCKIDGERSVSDLARDCGYTLFEAGHVIVSLVHAGLVDITEDVDVAGQTPYGASTLSAAWNDNTESAEGGRAWHDDSVSIMSTDDAEGDALSRLARLVTEVATGQPAQDGAPARMPVQERSLAEPWTRGVEPDESFAVALAKVSSALTDVLGPAETDVDPFDLPRGLRKPKQRTLSIVPADPEWDRRAKLRSAAAAELAAAHALAEALRPDDGHHGSEPEPETEPEPEPDADDAAQAAAAEEATRLAAEEAEAARVAAEEEEAARVAAEEEAARLAAEEAEAEAARLAAEEAEAEAARVAAEEEAARLAAEEEAARLAAEEEAARVAAEEEAARLAAEEAEAEAARLAAEEAEAEAARLAAEEEAARLAAEEEAARLAAEEESARIAAAEAEAVRIAAEEAEAARLAAEEEAARVAAEQEAARLAAEEEAARLAAEEAEAARVAADEEAARVAAEEEDAARVAAEAEFARIAAEQAAEHEAEAARIAAEQEFARLAAEEADAVLIVAEEAARLEAEQEATRELDVEDEEAETARRAADALELDESDLRAAEATALLGQLSAEPLRPMLTPAPEAEDEDVDDVPERDTSMDNDDDLYPMQRNEDMADTAALLRELSSLGTEDGDDDSTPGPPQSPRPAPRPAAGGDKKQRKKIGLFGL